MVWLMTLYLLVPELGDGGRAGPVTVPEDAVGIKI